MPMMLPLHVEAEQATQSESTHDVGHDVGGQVMTDFERTFGAN